MTAVSPPTVDERHDGGDGANGAGSAGGGAPRRRRWAWVAAVVVAAAAAIGGFVVLGDDDPAEEAGETAGERAGAPELPDPVVPELDDEAQDLVSLLEAGRAATYHATYTATGDPETTGGELTLEVWHRDGRIRQDSRQVSEGAIVETAGFLLEDGEAIVCQRIDEGDWSCARQTQASSDVFGAIASQLEGRDVVETEEEIDGRSVRCFSFDGGDGEISECVTEDGIPVRLRGPGTELLLVELSEDVPDDVFVPPAEPVAAEGDDA